MLVGGGHTHALVLEGLCRRPLPTTRLCVVLDRPRAMYSGMVPGFVAGDYAREQLEIDVRRLATRAGAEVLECPAVGIDPRARRIRLADGRGVDYAVASLDVGSTVAGRDIPGASEFAWQTRPIADFVDRVDAELSARRTARPARPSGSASPSGSARDSSQRIDVVVIGTGIAGIELAFCLEARLTDAGYTPRIQLVGRGNEPSVGASRRVVRRLRQLASARGIVWRQNFEVTRIEADAVEGSGAREGDGPGPSVRLPAERVVLAAGAAPHPWLRGAPLPHCERGFVRVADTLQVVGFSDLFAAGDCATLESEPWVPKAGVYAVRQAPVLEHNLRVQLQTSLGPESQEAQPESDALRIFRPQRDFLAIINLGRRRALATKWGLSVAGHLAWRLKSHIDLRFMRRFARFND